MPIGFTSILLYVACVWSCDHHVVPTVPRVHQEVAVHSLFEARGPEDADTAVIFVQGGPFTELRVDRVDELPGMTGRRRLVVHQPWTLNPDLLASPDAVPLDRAAELNLEALDALDRVVEFALEHHDAVCVVGHSYGALLTLVWLATHDRPVATQILAGRLALPDLVWTNFRDGRLYWFPDGVTPQPVPGETPSERLVAMRLQSDVGKRRFMDLLRGRDLSRMTFVYGDRDRLVGAMTQSETAFLNGAGARVVRLRGGDHRAMFEPDFAAVMEDVFTCERSGH